VEIRQDPLQLLRTRSTINAAVHETLKVSSRARKATRAATGWRGVDRALAEYGDALKRASKQLDRLGERVTDELQAAAQTMQSADASLADRFRDS